MERELEIRRHWLQVGPNPIAQIVGPVTGCISLNFFSSGYQACLGWYPTLDHLPELDSEGVHNRVRHPFYAEYGVEDGPLRLVAPGPSALALDGTDAEGWRSLIASFVGEELAMMVFDLDDTIPSRRRFDILDGPLAPRMPPNIERERSVPSESEEALPVKGLRHVFDEAMLHAWREACRS